MTNNVTPLPSVQGDNHEEEDTQHHCVNDHDFTGKLELNTRTFSLSNEWNLWGSFKTSFARMPDMSTSFLYLKRSRLHESTAVSELNTIDYQREGNSFKTNSSYLMTSLLAQTIDCTSAIAGNDEETARDLKSKIMQESHIFSPTYHPVPREQNEIRILAYCISVDQTSPRDKDETIYQLLFPNLGHPESVLLKHGAVSFRSKETPDLTSKILDNEKELILLNRGIIIASVTGGKREKRRDSMYSVNMDFSERDVSERDETSTLSFSLIGSNSLLSKIKKRNLTRIQYESCFLFSDIVSINDPVITKDQAKEELGDKPCSILLKVKRGTEITALYITCKDETQKTQWLHALSWSYYHYSLTVTSNENLVKGNHFKVNQTSLYSAAVRGDEHMLDEMLSLCRNLPLHEVDPYDGFSALHYAIMWNNIYFARTLILAGASVDTLSRNEYCSPLKYAKMLKNMEAITMLTKYEAEDKSEAFVYLHSNGVEKSKKKEKQSLWQFMSRKLMLREEECKSFCQSQPIESLF